MDRGRRAIALTGCGSYLADVNLIDEEDSLMADPAAVAEGFFDAWTGKDFQRARALLHDDVSFEGPIDTFSDADSYVASLQQLSGIVTGAEKQKVFVDGDDVCVIYDLKTAPIPSSRTCEWYRVRDGKLSQVSVVFDARPFAAMLEARGEH
jgi:ketosteroid isomerase-like protein